MWELQKRIESMKPYDGIISIDELPQETKVKFITDRINIEEIKAYIANCGYDADDVLAAPDAYNRLPRPVRNLKTGRAS